MRKSHTLMGYLSAATGYWLLARICNKATTADSYPSLLCAYHHRCNSLLSLHLYCRHHRCNSGSKQGYYDSIIIPLRSFAATASTTGTIAATSEHLSADTAAHVERFKPDLRYVLQAYDYIL
jgi:hypothetical protein